MSLTKNQRYCIISGLSHKKTKELLNLLYSLDRGSEKEIIDDLLRFRRQLSDSFSEKHSLSVATSVTSNNNSD